MQVSKLLLLIDFEMTELKDIASITKIGVCVCKQRISHPQQSSKTKVSKCLQMRHCQKTKGRNIPAAKKGALKQAPF